jgi:hypothetical protein
MSMRRPFLRRVRILAGLLFCTFIASTTRAMMALTVDPEAVNAPGAAEELRTSVRAYLTACLGKS